VTILYLLAAKSRDGQQSVSVLLAILTTLQRVSRQLRREQGSQTTSDPAASAIEHFRTQINGGAPSTDDFLPVKLNPKPALITYCPDP
jgi:hypothetical protein